MINGLTLPTTILLRLQYAVYLIKITKVNEVGDDLKSCFSCVFLGNLSFKMTILKKDYKYKR